MEKEKKRNERKGEWKKVAIEENKKKEKYLMCTWFQFLVLVW